MTEIKYVSGNRAIVCLKGIRSVLREEVYGESLVQPGPSRPRKKLYVLEIKYEDIEKLVIEYEDEQERDNMYEKMRDMYTKGQIGEM